MSAANVIVIMGQENMNEFVGFAVEARKYQTLLTEKYKRRRSWVAPNDHEVRSHIPGTIVSIEVSEGQVVKAGELLLIHEYHEDAQPRGDAYGWRDKENQCRRGRAYSQGCGYGRDRIGFGGGQ